MGKTAKILVTIGIVFLFFIVYGAIVGAMRDADRSTPGILGLIAFGGLIGALKAIWKDSNKEDNDNNNSILQK